MPDPSRTQEFLLGQLSTGITNLSNISDKLGDMVQAHGEQLVKGVEEFKYIHTEIAGVGKSVDDLKNEFHQCREENMRRGPCFYEEPKHQPAMVINVPKIDLGVDWKLILKIIPWIVGVLLAAFGVKSQMGH